jgi:hypothetical protein
MGNNLSMVYGGNYGSDQGAGHDCNKPTLSEQGGKGMGHQDGSVKFTIK